MTKRTLVASQTAKNALKRIQVGEAELVSQLGQSLTHFTRHFFEDNISKESLASFIETMTLSIDHSGPSEGNSQESGYSIDTEKIVMHPLTQRILQEVSAKMTKSPNIFRENISWFYYLVTTTFIVII